MSRHFPGLAVTFVAAALLHAAPAAAQRLELQAGHGWSSEQDLASGNALSLSLRLHTLPLEVRAEWMGASLLRIGSTCTGQIPPEATTGCGPEPLRVHAFTALAGVGVPLRLYGTPRFQVVARPVVMAGMITGRRRGEDSGRALDSAEPLGGAGIGIDLQWRPLTDPHWLVSAGASQLWLSSLDRTVVADGYQPYNHSTSIRALRAGVGYAF